MEEKVTAASVCAQLRESIPDCHTTGKIRLLIPANDKARLTRAEVEDRQLTYGKNEVVHEQKKNPFIVFIKTFINPFIGVLTGLAVISLVIDVLMAEPGEQEWTGVVIIAVMVVCSASCVSGRNGKPMKPQIH